MPRPLQLGFTVGPFRVLPQQNQLEGPDGPVHVEPKVMDVLLVLAAHPGEVVSRQALLDAVWNDVVVLDETLTKAIQVLRGHFGDKPANPTFIRTVPRRGYVLIAPVGMLDDAPPGDAVMLASSPSPSPSRPRPETEGVGNGAAPRRRWWGPAVAVIVVLFAVVAALAWLRGGFHRETVTVAVIPPVASGDSAELGFLGEGLADYLIDQLSRTRRLDVVARRSSFGMRDTETNVKAIGEQLGARYLVEGSLRHDRAGLLLTLFLVDTESGTNVWTTQLHGLTDGVLALQLESAARLREAIRNRLGIAMERVVDTGPRISDEAYRKFLEARYQWSLRGERRIDRSIELLEEALAIEPRYAAARLALAQSVALRAFYTSEPIADAFALARDSAAQALALDPKLAADVAALEGFMLFKERRWFDAQASLRRAIELAPDNVDARYWYAEFLCQIGRYQEALVHLRRAQSLDPVSAVINDRLAITYVWVNDLDNAAERYRVAADLGYVESTQPLSQMMFLFRAGRFEELAALLLRLGGDPGWVRPTVAALEHSDQRQAASELIDGWSNPDSLLDMVRFGIWFLFEQTDRAFRDFDASPESRYVEALWVPEAAHMRVDQRFEGLLAELGFTGVNRALVPATNP